MTGQVGGAYAALMGKKNKPQQQTKSEAKPKAAKTISLKDTKDNNAKKTAPAKAPQQKTEQKAAPAPEKALTKREQKDERSAHDKRSHPRSGHAPAHGKKTDEVQDAVDAANAAEIDPAKKEELEARRKEAEAREAERKAEEEAEARRITYAEYEKQLAEKKKDLGWAREARKIEEKPGMAQLKKEEDATFTVKAKKDAPKVEKKEEKKGKKVEEPAKKKKFAKSDNLKLGFFAAAPRDQRGPRPPRKEHTPAPAPTPAPTPAPAAEAATE